MAFELITEGPSNATGQNPACAPNGLTLDAQNNIVASVGLSATESVLETQFALLRAQTAITAITTAQTLFSKSLKAYFLNRAGRTLRVKGWMVYSTTGSNVATITLALELGSVTLCSIATTATNTAASVNLPIAFEFLLSVSSTGKIGAVSVHGNVKAELGTAATTAIVQFIDNVLDAIDTITIGTNPAVGDTVTVNGTAVAFIVNGGTPVGNQVALGSTAAATATALYTFLNASTDANIAKAVYTNPSSGVVVATSAVAGFMPIVGTSVPAKITFSNTPVDLTSALTLAVAMSAGVAAIPSAQLQLAQIEVVA
jgi:hypothetical protein